MRDTPRTFVGTVTVRLASTVSGDVAQSLRGMPALLAGVRVCEVDEVAGTVLVTAQQPTDCGDVAAALERRGCRIRT
jgi:hypothetical protein